jgi:hypothetical protein
VIAVAATVAMNSRRVVLAMRELYPREFQEFKDLRI